jgi:hypothetical protein
LRRPSLHVEVLPADVDEKSIKATARIIELCARDS